MSQVEEVIDTLISAIKVSDEYLEYQRAKQTILKYPILKEKADEFLRQNYEMQKKSSNLYEHGDHLRREYASVVSNPIIWDYVNAENAFCRILRRVNGSLLEELDFDVAFEDY